MSQSNINPYGAVDLSALAKPAAPAGPTGTGAPAAVTGLVVDVDEAGFQAVVDQSMTVPVVIDFWADWCGPCKRIRPVLESLAAEWGGRVRVVSLDIDANPNATRDYGVLGAPTMMLFRAGEPVRTVVGAHPKSRLVAQLESALPESAL